MVRVCNCTWPPPVRDLHQPKLNKLTCDYNISLWCVLYFPNLNKCVSELATNSGKGNTVDLPGEKLGATQRWQTTVKIHCTAPRYCVTVLLQSAAPLYLVTLYHRGCAAPCNTVMIHHHIPIEPLCSLLTVLHRGIAPPRCTVLHQEA